MEKYKVLIVEDNDAARKQLARVVRKEGFEVVEAENGRAGLEIFKKELPEIVITDLKMPDIDGLEVMHTVRRTSPNAQVILVTAFGETDTAISALHEGALDYLKKPLDIDQLSLALGRAKEKIAEYKKTPFFPNLLLAEDEVVTRERITRVLEKEGWKVFAVADGKEAIDVFQQTKIDIALLDIKMPQKDGLEALHEMRSMTHDFEAIILTGYGNESSAIQAMHDGAINFLRKPIDLDQMILAVEKALEKLTAKRTLKYRNRELELTRELIARITVDKELIIDVRDHLRKPARDFAQKLLDAIPLGIIVLDKEFKIRYVNHHLASKIECKPETIDEEFVKELSKIGINKISHDSLINSVNKTLESPIGTVEKISVGRYGYLTLTAISILGEERKETVVLIAMRGER